MGAGGSQTRKTAMAKPSTFRKVYAQFGDGEEPEQFAEDVTFNTEQGIQFKTQTGEEYIPDPANPEGPVPRNLNVTGYSMTFTGSGTADKVSIPKIVDRLKAGEAVNMKVWLGTVGYWAVAMKSTDLSVKGDTTTGKSATCDGTFESDGDYVWHPAP
jgi:hypothetical protein